MGGGGDGLVGGYESIFITILWTLPWGSFHKAILATINLSYLWLILIFTSVPRNNFKTIINPTHVENIFLFLFHLTG